MSKAIHRWATKAAGYWSVCSLVCLLAGIGPLVGESVQAEVVQQASASEQSTILSDASNGLVERTLFDVYLGDALQGGILANYTEQWLEIDSPQDVLEQIKDLEPQQQADLLPLFEGRIVGTREIAGVGSVTFDIFTFRLVVTLSPEYLRAKKLDLTDRLPDPEKGFSIQQNVGVAASGDSNNESNAAFSHRTVFGSGRFFGRISGVAVQDEAYELSEASTTAYLGDYELGGGYLETLGFSFASSVQFTGARLKTSEDIIIDPERSTGNRLEIFVPSRSRVEFYRNERLLGVQVLEFGLQEVDTTSFPQGSYDVEVVIIESNGNVVRDRKFFTKSGYLSIRGRPTYELQVGTIRDEFSTTTDSIYQGGVRWRAADILDVAGSIAGTQDITIGGLEFTALYRDSFLRLNGGFSDEGDSGVGGSFSTELLGASFSFGGAKTLELSDYSRSLAPAPTPTPRPGVPPEFVRPADRVDQLFFQDRSSYSASARRTFGKVDLGYQAQRDQFRDGLDRFSRGPSLQWRMLEGSSSALRFQTALYDTEQGDVFNASLNHRYRLSQGWNLSSQIGFFDRDSTGQEVVAYVGVSYDAADRVQNSTKLNYSSEVRRTERDTGGKATTTATNQLSGTYAGDYVQSQLFLYNQSGSGADSGVAYGVNAESAVLVSGDGAAAVSYPPGKDAVFIADIKGALPDAKFEIVLNDQVYATVNAGKRSAVGVEPFKTYRVYIRPVEGDQLIEYDSTTYQITFFPGNVIRKTFEARKVSIVLGRLVDAQGRAIPFQRIRGPKDYVATDEDGNFQAELSGHEELSVDSSDYKCVLAVDIDPGGSQFVTELGDLVCSER